MLPCATLYFCPSNIIFNRTFHYKYRLEFRLKSVEKSGENLLFVTGRLEWAQPNNDLHLGQTRKVGQGLDKGGRPSASFWVSFHTSRRRRWQEEEEEVEVEEDKQQEEEVAGLRAGQGSKQAYWHRAGGL